MNTNILDETLEHILQSGSDARLRADVIQRLSHALGRVRATEELPPSSPHSLRGISGGPNYLAALIETAVSNDILRTALEDVRDHFDQNLTLEPEILQDLYVTSIKSANESGDGAGHLSDFVKAVSLEAYQGALDIVRLAYRDHGRSWPTVIGTITVHNPASAESAEYLAENTRKLSYA